MSTAISTTTRVLMAGCGNMGGALLTRWLQQDGFKFTVVSPSGRSLPEGVVVVRSVEELQGQQFDLMVIAVKPQMIKEVLPAYVDLVKPDGCFISIAAGFSVDSIERLIGARALVRTMPNMPVSIGKGVSALFSNQHVTEAQSDTVASLMQATGELIWVEDEDAVDRVTAIAGSGPGYAYEIARCWVRAGQSLGFSEAQARRMVLQTLAGTIELALTSNSSLEELRNGVTSKNGTTAAGLAALNGDQSLDDLLRQTVEAAYARAVELR